MKARVVIVGGGVVGLSIALHAARRTDPLKQPVMLLERNTIGEGPDALSGAVLSQVFEARDVAGMARDSLRYYRGIEERTARSLGYLGSGVLTLPEGSDPEDFTRLREQVAMLDSIGIEVELVDAERMRRLFPGIQVSDSAIGAWEPTAGCLDPQRALQSLATLARNRGAVIREGTAVTAILVEDGEVVGVETESGRIDCEDVVVAGGPWTNKLLQPLGLELPLELMRANYCYMASTIEQPDEATLESSLVMAGPESSGATGWYPGGFVRPASLEAEGEIADQVDEDRPALRIAHPVLTDPAKGFYIRCDPLNSRVTIGRRGFERHEIVDDPDEFDAKVSGEFLAWARDVVESRLPPYADVHEIGAQTRLFTRTPDELPILGGLEQVRGLHLACAFSGKSFMLAPSIGEGMAQSVLGEPVSAYDPTLYTPMRFA